MARIIRARKIGLGRSGNCESFIARAPQLVPERVPHCHLTDGLRPSAHFKIGLGRSGNREFLLRVRRNSFQNELPAVT